MRCDYVPYSQNICDDLGREVLSTKELLLGVGKANARGGYIKFY